MVAEDIPPYGNEPETLKNLGNLITFWGGMDTQIVLLKYSPDQIRQWVKRCIENLAPGYIPSTNHVIERDVPPENILATYEAIKDFGKY